MAQKVHVEVLDDIDGTEASQTIPFGLDGVSYEIDLSDDNAAALRAEFEPYVMAGRRTGGRKVRLATGQSASVTGTSAAPSATDRERNRQIRAWAQDNGYDVAERGRLSSEIIEAYETAQQVPKSEPIAKSSRKRAPRKKKVA
ncbi:histone-like nucleoid-structuring protein Lsr2 [Amycolatopsis sp. CA-230715]|uniref:histone-like nucleoid-structuring protein Lsr2 n=1 Tax=Amycolatopsis sp. CA-230715 TaxID=2745196 RepID=UPI001C015B4E|nr:Lsr2 family protein [Amycolatopsis sp. CA-230715]QWF85823.1 Nucleoid-associated protein Lsr2 [Amycolatopsis sp. CA-230715]